jgi:hypothetical protein
LKTFLAPQFVTNKSFVDLFTWVFVVVFLAVGLHLWRPGLIALLAISTALCLETANSFLYFNDVESASSEHPQQAHYLFSFPFLHYPCLRFSFVPAARIAD